ncbi:NUDIX hydrolase [Pedobacter puniceum]|uniref:NUDIX domain-containing protein n=1 Tax=Pedobacter puniceum TaxID=2666136 RepID=A0A7K0FQF3_9SPHI|nr:NUDIX domain-containing protein [Pedobacter puniceum]MRX48186.1 NUDIX domain-containing protein [Pedobacter puniceum]
MENIPVRFESIFSADCIIFGFDEGELKILLIERNEEPFKEWFALPGNVVYQSESIDEAAERILYELTGLKGIYMEQFYTFGEVNRHPKGRVITVAYFAMIRLNGQKELKPITNYAKKAVWVSVKDLPKLAFDHSEIFKKGFEKIKNKISYQPIAFELLPEKFTLTQLQNLYEVILNKKLDKRNFRKKMLAYDILKELDEKQKGVSYRAAKLYKFDKRKYSKYFHNELSFGKE